MVIVMLISGILRVWIRSRGNLNLGETTRDFHWDADLGVLDRSPLLNQKAQTGGKLDQLAAAQPILARPYSRSSPANLVWQATFPLLVIVRCGLSNSRSPPGLLPPAPCLPSLIVQFLTRGICDLLDHSMAFGADRGCFTEMKKSVVDKNPDP
ncbi:hypothetical protein TorRG33x02_223950 [Trema orientale]|uniref:Uncharacterized protein n=1 Tax=Trema orientale TaxID=63057 RepID=A0A2P5E8E9_TREOI|nr:hypothetical protein TorRG33x02_223950 [Trema orientale]